MGIFTTFIIIFLLFGVLYIKFIDICLLKLFTYICKFTGVLTVLIYLSCLFATILHKYWPGTHILPQNRAILITGCDSGFGHYICYKLDSYGFHVFAGVLSTDSENVKKLQTNCSECLKIIKLDVTQVEDVKNAVKEIENSGLDLWAVLNNAGVPQNGMIEMGTELEDFERVFAVNVFGLVRVTKHCLPLLRRCGGRVVNMSSFAARLTVPGATAYCMSKFSVRAFSDGLRTEIMRFGVKVITIEPFFYKTNITDENTNCKAVDDMWRRTDPQIRKDYGGDRFCNKLNEMVKFTCITSRAQIHEVIDTQLEAITACEPECNYSCAGLVERLALYLLIRLPESAQYYIFNKNIWKTLLILNKL